jgi:cupin fold WbuC family metalloprotein
MRLFEDKLIDDLVAKAAASPRRRAHFNIHGAASDPVQRFIVVAQPDSYFRPHLHRTNAELSTVLRGQFDLVIFDEGGRVIARHGIGEGTGQFAYEAPTGTWHTLVAMNGPFAFLEVKQGPYDPATAVEFASWAPAEGEGTVPHFQQWLREAQVGSLYSSGPATISGGLSR